MYTSEVTSLLEDHHCDSSYMYFSPDLPEGRGTSPKDAEALVIALDQTKTKLE